MPSSASPKPRYVFDTNATISAALFEHSVPGQAYDAALNRGEILLSQATTFELNDVLGRPKFDRYLTREEREQFLVMLLTEATVVEISEEIRACRDPKDDKFLELQLAAKPLASLRVITISSPYTPFAASPS